MECGAPARTRFPDIYREFESLQGQVRQAAQDYIINPQAGPVPLEVRNIEVRSSTVFYSVIYSGCQEHSAVGCMEQDTSCQFWTVLCGSGSQVWTVLCVSGCQVSRDPG